MNFSSKNLTMWIMMLFVIGLLYVSTQSDLQKDKRTADITYSALRTYIDEGKVAEIKINENEITGTFVVGKVEGLPNKFKTYLPTQDEALIPALLSAKVKFDGSPKETKSLLIVFVESLLPIIILVAVWVFFMRQMNMGGGKALSFGKSRAKLMEETDNKVTFKDVAGIEESKEELTAIVQFLKDPKKFTRLGGRIPKGVLLVGSPGTGKTLLAKAIAGEAGVPFFSISGSDFVEMFVGVGASRVRDLFMKGKKNAPCIIFIDEIDAVGRHRGAGLGGGHDEREQTLNQLLVEMDGFEPNEGVILIAATNRPDVLDPALLRPGRFDRTVVVALPDLKGRTAILEVHIKKVPLDEDVNLEVVARGTPGFSGADIANLVNEAALYAALKDNDKVNMQHFEYAKDKIMMGVERKSLVLSENDRKIIAYHEAGHAIIAKLIPNADPLHKVTIVPRGVALGLVQQLPERDKHNYPKTYWLDRMCIAFGGRASEELIFAEITTGASGDISAATNIARRMVCEWGMSERLGPISYGSKEGALFLGKELTHEKNYSEPTASMIDEEVRMLIDSQLERARKILKENHSKLERLALALLEHETLDLAQVDMIMAGDDVH